MLFPILVGQGVEVLRKLGVPDRCPLAAAGGQMCEYRGTGTPGPPRPSR